MWIGSFRILLNICLLVEIHISEILYCMTFVLNFFIRAASCSTVLSFFFFFLAILWNVIMYHSMQAFLWCLNYHKISLKKKKKSRVALDKKKLIWKSKIHVNCVCECVWCNYLYNSKIIYMINKAVYLSLSLSCHWFNSRQGSNARYRLCTQSWYSCQQSYDHYLFLFLRIGTLLHQMWNCIILETIAGLYIYICYYLKI